MKRLCLALSLAASAASAQDCDRQPFPLEPRLPRAAVKPERSGQPTPPEIARIRNGVISASAGIPPGVGPLYQAWLAYDFDRAIFIAVDSASYDGRRPRPDKPLRPNQAWRYVKEDQINRAELVTIMAATAGQAREVACMANRVVNIAEWDTSPPLLDMPSADAWVAVHILKDGKRLRTQTAKAKPVKEQLGKLLQTALQLTQP